MIKDKKYILVIDTSDKETGIGLVGEGLNKTKVWISERNQSQELLPNIDNLLKENGINPEELKWVSVNLGPGTFTGLRVGLSVANTFGYALNIPVIGIDYLEDAIEERIKKLSTLETTEKEFKQVLPTYGKPPDITKPKNNW